MIWKNPWFEVDSVKPGWREKLRMSEYDRSERSMIRLNRDSLI